MLPEQCCLCPKSCPEKGKRVHVTTMMHNIRSQFANLRMDPSRAQPGGNEREGAGADKMTIDSGSLKSLVCMPGLHNGNGSHAGPFQGDTPFGHGIIALQELVGGPEIMSQMIIQIQNVHGLVL